MIKRWKNFKSKGIHLKIPAMTAMFIVYTVTIVDNS